MLPLQLVQPICGVLAALWELALRVGLGLGRDKNNNYTLHKNA